MAHGATYARLLQMVYWDSMWSDCLQWSKDCLVCDVFRKPDLAHGLLQPTTTASLKGKRQWNVDLAGPFEPDEFGNTYLLIVVDREDLWPTLIPLKGALAAETTRGLCTIMADSGVPEVVMADQGSNFTAEHTIDFYRAMGIDPKFAPPESPWVNGAAEAMVKISKSVTAKLVEERRKVWSSLIWLTHIVLRSRELAGWKITPFEARFARKMRTPAMFDLAFDDEKVVNAKDLKEIKLAMEKRRDEVAKEMKEKFDKKVEDIEFKENDRVWLIPRVKEGALQPRKIGPFKIIEVMGKVHVKIRQLNGGPSLGSRSEFQSIRNLERYEHEEIYRQKELVVKKVLGHDGKGRGRKYKVFWEDGTTSMEPRKQLVDKDPEGTETINAELLAYLDRNPKLSRNV